MTAPKGPRKSKERKLAFQTLYGASFNPSHDLQALIDAYNFSRGPKNETATDALDEPSGYAWDLARGVYNNEKELDELINRFSRNWRADRLGRIEHLILRLALYEIQRGEPQPRLLILDVLDLADAFGAEKAKSFINGILDSALRSGEFA